LGGRSLPVVAQGEGLFEEVVVAVIGTIFTLIFGIMAAYFFARYKMPFGNVIWAAFLFLMLMAGVANIVPLFMLLKNLNLLNTLWTLIIIGIAGGQIFNIYAIRNFIEEIPKDLFEAAEMDGASHLNQILNIVIPVSGPIIGTLAILAFLGKGNDFLMPLIILRDPELFTIGVGLIYPDGEYIKQRGQIMAAFFVASIPLIVMFLFTMQLFVLRLGAGAVKG
jgi:ABC-type glycerol-3-phosphate transport system permease component